LSAKLVAWEADNGQVIVGFVKRLQASVLRGCTARTGNVDHQPSAAAKFAQCSGFAVHGRKRKVKGGGHGWNSMARIMKVCFGAKRANPLEVPLDGRVMQVLMETSAGNITIDLFHGSAPDTVANFVKLVNMGHYDGLHFHRVIEDFMIQGGCPHSKDPMSRLAGNGGPGWQIPCEPSALALKHDKPGVLSMANAGRNTGGSQFFLTTIPTPWLNGNHAVFGAVSDGMDVVHTIERCRKLPGDRPAEPQQIIRCTVIE
jgi:cyclophilin family peptidyl-prolyl cis-trans isomerase